MKGEKRKVESDGFILYKNKILRNVKVTRHMPISRLYRTLFLLREICQNEINDERKWEAEIILQVIGDNLGKEARKRLVERAGMGSALKLYKEVLSQRHLLSEEEVVGQGLKLAWLAVDTLKGVENQFVTDIYKQLRENE